MAAIKFSFDVSGARRLAERLGVGARVAEAPMLGQRGKRLVGIARNGPGGFREQFANEAGQTIGRGTERWKKTKAFGRQAAPRKTLQRTGAYRSAWLGGPGSIERIGPKRFELGVDPTMFPQVTAFQSPQGRRIGVTSKMRYFLGYAFGVWLKKSTRSLLIPRRAVGMGIKVKHAIAAALKDEVLKAYKQQARRAA